MLTQVGGAPLLLRNDQQLGHNFVRLKLAGTRSNRDAIGAWVTLTADGVKQSRQVMPAKSYLSASEPAVTFGLGRGGKENLVEIQCPSGARQSLTNVVLNQRVVVVEEPK